MSAKDDLLVKLVAALEDPTNEWHDSRWCYTLNLGLATPRCDPKFMVWIGSGWMSCDTYPTRCGFSLWQRRKLWKAVQVAQAHIASRKLANALAVHRAEKRMIK